MQHRAARIAVSALLAVLVAAPAGAAAGPAQVPTAVAAANGTSKWAEGRVLVGYAKGASKAERKAAHEAAKASRARPLAGAPGVEIVDTALGVAEAIRRLKGAKGVRYAQPDYVVRTSFVPDDPSYGLQWGLEQTNDVDIDASAAWDVTTGASTIVAVIDTGIQLDHPDLAANVWTNPGEIAGNGIDDDDDGYVDDVHGWDFVDDDNDPTDENGHGTHVSGTIAAVGDNTTGVTGVAFGSRILPLRMLDAGGSGYLSDGVRALAYATAHGARVANLSWTYGGPISQPLWDGIESAGEAGMLVTAAAGNHDLDADVQPEYPAAFDLPTIVSVAALARNGTLASFSNRGLSRVDVAAPGVHIYSTWKNGGYMYLDGTSMASPHVAGVAALLVSEHPGWTAIQVRDRLLGTTHPLAALAGLVGTGGLVDAAAAVGPGVDRAPVVAITAPLAGSRVQPGTAVHLAATALDPEDGDVAASITWLSNLMGKLGTGPTVTRADLTVGTHLIVATAHDAAGHRRSATVRVQVRAPISIVDEHAEPRTPTIAVAPDGTPVLTWAEDGTGTVVSRGGGGDWSREVASASYADRTSDALVDPSGVIHVAIERDWKDVGAASDGGILVAADDGTGAGTGWTLDRVSESCGDDADDCGIDEDPSIARDPSGRLQLAWSRVPVPNVVLAGNDPGLWHAVSHASGAWTSELILAADDVLLPDLATAADGAAHIVFWRSGGDADGLYHASDETGDWVIELIAPPPGDADVGAPSVQVGAGGRVDVAWAGSTGVIVRSRVGGTWDAPVAVSDEPAADVDLVRDGAALHLAFGTVDGTGLPTGVEYALEDGAGWTVQGVDVGRDEHPRVAVDSDGAPHVSYLRSFPEHEVRHAVKDGSAWATDVVDEGWTWTEPAIGVDAAGHHHVAVGRYGTEPGVWYATDRTGTWTLERLTQVPPDGPVALVAGPDGSVAVAYAERLDAGDAPLADPAVWLKTRAGGAWTTRRIATNTGGAAVSLARGSTGRLYLAFSTGITGRVRIAVATNASGSWATAYATPGAVATRDTSPSIAVDPHGKLHLAYEERTPATSASAIRYATNVTGVWVRSLISSGSAPRVGPRLALTSAGAPRIAYWIQDLAGSGSLGIRLASRSGTAWATRIVSTDRYDTSPALAVDPQGHAHLLWARGVTYAICSIPFCAEAPGLRQWTDAPGFGAARRVTDHAEDDHPALVRGADGSIAGAFAAPAWRIGAIDLWEPPPSASALAVHLAASGTVAPGRSRLAVTFTGRHAAKFRLGQQVGGGAWHTVGSVTGSMGRSLSIALSPTTRRRFRVTAYDGLGRAGNTVTGATVRTWGHSEAPGSGVAYAGSWTTAHGGAFWGGSARVATSASAAVTWTITAREIAWTALRAPSQGDARVYVDGMLVTTIHLGTGTAAYRQVVFRRIFGSVGTHRLTIKPAGNGRVTVDGFLALR